MYHKDEEDNQGGHRGWMWGAGRVLEDDKEGFKSIEDGGGCDCVKKDLSMCYSTIEIVFQTLLLKQLILSQ